MKSDAVITTTGAVTLTALETASFTKVPIVNVDVSDVSVTIESGASIDAGDVTINATADNENIFPDDGGLGTFIANKLTQAIEGLTQILAGFSYSKSTATVEIQAGSSIHANNFLAHARATTSAITDPVAATLFGPAAGIDIANATATLAGSLTTTGNATIQASVDNTLNVRSDTTGAKGAAAALAVGVIDSESTSQVTDDAVLVVGGNLNVVSGTVNRTRVMSRSTAGHVHLMDDA